MVLFAITQESPQERFKAGPNLRALGIFRLPSSTDIHPIRLWIGMVLGCGHAYFLLEQDPSIGWLNISFFGLGAVVFSIQLLTNYSYLKLHAEGFEEKTLIRTKRHKWSDVRGFRQVITAETKVSALITRMNTANGIVEKNYQKNKELFLQATLLKLKICLI